MQEKIKKLSKGDNEIAALAIMQISDNEINLDSTWIRFIEDEDGRGPGVSAFCIEANDNESLLKKANDLGLVHQEEIFIGGVKFLLS